MIPCPVCNRDADHLLCEITFDPTEIALIRKLNSYWVENDGICQTCLKAIRVSAQRLHEQFAKATSSTNFREYHRYFLNRQDSGQWNHRNPDIAKWRQKLILEVIEAQAERDGCDAWALFDADENLIAQGVGANDGIK